MLRRVAMAPTTPAIGRPSQSGAQLVERYAQREIYNLRQTSRQRSIQRVQKALARAGVPADAILPGDGTLTDAARAKRAARGMADHWRRKFDEALGTGRGASAERQAARQAGRAIDARVRTTAATESASAFGQARESLQFVQTAELYKLWDAALDRRTCPTCELSHGEMVHHSARFSHGTPGSVHPNCRCIEELITVQEWRQVNARTAA